MSEELYNWWLAVQAWWQELPPDVQTFLQSTGILLAAFVAGVILGGWAGRRLRAAGFDASLRPPWSPSTASGRSEAPTFTPTRVAGGIVRLTVWGCGVWFLAGRHGWTNLAGALEWIAGRVWSLALVTVVALYLARLCAEKLIDLVQNPPLKERWEAWLPPAAGRERRWGGAAVLAGVTVYGVVVLLVLLVAADLMGWTLTGHALSALWNLALHLFTAGVALLIGWLGAQWARTQAAPDAVPVSPVAQVGYYAALGIMGGATVLAILLLSGNPLTLSGLVLLALLALLLWPARAYLPDLWAGILLKVQKVKAVRLGGAMHQLGAVGPLLTQLTGPEGNLTRRNRLVLEAHLRSASPEEGPPH